MQRFNLNPADTLDAWLYQIIPLQSEADLLNARLVSRSWCQFYSTPDVWKKAIETHFGFHLKTIGEFEALVFSTPGTSEINYRIIYQRLAKLKATKFEYHISIDNLFKNQDRHLPLLVCCLGDPGVAKKTLPPLLHPLWREFALVLDAAAIFKELYRQEKYLYDALRCGADKIVHCLIENDIEFHISGCLSRASVLQEIFSKGNDDHINELINTQPISMRELKNYIGIAIRNRRVPLAYTYKLFVDAVRKDESQPLRFPDYVLDEILSRKEIASDSEAVDKFIRFLWKTNHNYDENYKIRDSYCCHLVSCGYLDYLKFLLREGQVKLPLSSYIVGSLAEANALTPENLDFFFNPVNRWALPQAGENLKGIIQGGYYDVFLYLMNPANGFHFQLTNEVFLFTPHSENPAFLEYLKAHHTADSPKPTPWALELSIRRENSDNARLLLDPVFDPKPTQEHLERAIVFRLPRVVEALMDEGRQFNLRFTEEMLKLACEPNDFLRYHPPSLDIIRFMLQPRFGLTLTQAFFDRLYTEFNNHRAYTQYNSAEVILFLLENYNVTLTQAKFEELVTRREMLAVAELPVTYPDRFSTLKPTLAMVHKALELKRMDYVDYLLQPYFGLSVDQGTFGRAIYDGFFELAEKFQALYKFIPTASEIIQLLKLGNSRLAKKWIAALDIEINDCVLYELSKMQSRDGLEVLLSWAKEKGLLGFAHPVESRVPIFCIELNELLLDPVYHISFNFSHIGEYGQKDVDLVYAKSPAVKRLIESDQAIKLAINQLKLKVDPARAFNDALTDSPCQCYRVAAYAISHASEYGLDALAKERLAALMAGGLENIEQYSLADLLVIKKYLVSAKIALIEQGNFLLAEKLQALHQFSSHHLLQHAKR